jgi:hypothetical protein
MKFWGVCMGGFKLTSGENYDMGGIVKGNSMPG